jgi:hypothetical protein
MWSTLQDEKWWMVGVCQGLWMLNGEGRNFQRGQELTSSKPLLATILILFGIGYTIDYNSMSPLLHGVCLADLVFLPLLLFSASRFSLLPSKHRFVQQCTSNTTRTELIRVYGDECISMNWIVEWMMLTSVRYWTSSRTGSGPLSMLTPGVVAH